MGRILADRLMRAGRGLIGAVLVCVAVPAHASEITDTAFADARFEEAAGILMGAEGGVAKPKTALLWVYQSKLGSYLQSRDPKPDEVAELRRLCAQMHRAAQASRRGVFDGYGIEFADGRGDTSKLSASKRVVFFFWDRGACRIAPSRGTIG